MDRRQKLGGTLISQAWEGMELVATLVVTQVGLLDYELLEDGVRLLFRGDGPRDALDDLEREVGDNHRVLVLLGCHSIYLKRRLKLPEPEFRVLGNFRFGARDAALTSVAGLSSCAAGVLLLPPVCKRARAADSLLAESILYTCVRKRPFDPI